DGDADRRPRRTRLLPAPARKRCRGRRRHRPCRRARDPSFPAEPKCARDAVPQHDARCANDERSGRGKARLRFRRGFVRALRRMGVVTMARANEKEAADFLAAHPEIVQFQAFLTDPSGVARGKVLRPEELPGAYRDGRPLPCSIESLDILGADVLETGLVWEEGDSDRPCFPVAGTLTHAPWHDVPTAQLILESWERDGSPTPADPRHALA